MSRQKRNMASVSQIFNHWASLGANIQTKYHCFECGKKCHPHPERAHIIAKFEVGSDSADNLVLVCHSCHSLTDGRTKEQWIDRLTNGIGSITFFYEGCRIPADVWNILLEDKEIFNLLSEALQNDLPISPERKSLAMRRLLQCLAPC